VPDWLRDTLGESNRPGAGKWVGARGGRLERGAAGVGRDVDGRGTTVAGDTEPPTGVDGRSPSPESATAKPIARAATTAAAIAGGA